MSEIVVQEKAFNFAVRVVRMYQPLVEHRRENVLSKQCLRNGTAIGALLAESAHAQSKADFINKVSIALKEANETLYWLNLLKATGYLAEVEHKSIYEDAEELVRILVAILKTSKKNR